MPVGIFLRFKVDSSAVGRVYYILFLHFYAQQTLELLLCFNTVANTGADLHAHIAPAFISHGYISISAIFGSYMEILVFNILRKQPAF